MRRLWWRLVFQVRGGLTITGVLPPGAYVVVANCPSTVDSPVLRTVLPGRAPVHHLGGGGPEPLALLASGATVAVAGDVVEACRIAARAGVRVVPVGVAGTETSRAQPAAVRIGRPVEPDPAVVAAAVRELAAPPAPRADSRIRTALARFARSPAGLLAVAAWAAAEATAWPLLPEFALAILGVAAPRRAVRLAFAAAAGSLAGGALTYTLAVHGVVLPAPLTTARMHATALAQLATEGASALSHQPMSGIPYKVYGAAAGHVRVGLVPFLWASLPARSLRIVLVGGLAGAFGAAMHRWRRWYPAYLLAFVTLFAAGLAAVVLSWR
jgi:membrane protein YqaA with SNARE-associated domain